MQTQALLPLVTYPDANSDAVADHAVAMAAALDASLHALAINADIPDIANAVSRLLLDVPALIRRAEEMSSKRGTDLLSAVERRAGAVGVETTANALASRLTFLGDVAVTHARYFDYVLCGWESGNPTARTTAEAIIFGSGRPVILLPELAAVGSMSHVAIAWDGSRVAARAVADARHLLQRATKISVLSVLDEKPLDDEDAAERLAGGLSQRGWQADAIGIRNQPAPVATILQERALELGAGILVMGAYGHSRMREFVLGGATAGVLADLRLPVLLSH